MKFVLVDKEDGKKELKLQSHIDYITKKPVYVEEVRGKSLQQIFEESKMFPTLKYTPQEIEEMMGKYTSKQLKEIIKKR